MSGRSAKPEWIWGCSRRLVAPVSSSRQPVLEAYLFQTRISSSLGRRPFFRVPLRFLILRNGRLNRTLILVTRGEIDRDACRKVMEHALNRAQLSCGIQSIDAETGIHSLVVDRNACIGPGVCFRLTQFGCGDLLGRPSRLKVGPGVDHLLERDVAAG